MSSSSSLIPSQEMNKKMDIIESILHLLFSTVFSSTSDCRSSIYDEWICTVPKYNGGDSVHDVCFISMFVNLLFCRPLFSLEIGSGFTFIDDTSVIDMIPHNSILHGILPHKERSSKIGSFSNCIVTYRDKKISSVVHPIATILEEFFSTDQKDIVNRRHIKHNFMYNDVFKSVFESYRTIIISGFIDFITGDKGTSKPNLNRYNQESTLLRQRFVEHDLLKRRRINLIKEVLTYISMDTKIKYQSYVNIIASEVLGGSMEISEVQDIHSFHRSFFMDYIRNGHKDPDIKNGDVNRIRKRSEETLVFEKHEVGENHCIKKRKINDD